MGKRRLNVIFFVDSARTRSFTMPVSRLTVLLVLLAGVVTWSIASVFVIAWLGQDREGVAARLRTSLTTIFEYETRYDGVYDVAYPNGKGDKGGTMASPVVADADGDEVETVVDAMSVVPDTPRVAAKAAVQDGQGTQAAPAAPSARPKAEPVNTAAVAKVEEPSPAPSPKSGVVAMAAKPAPAPASASIAATATPEPVATDPAAAGETPTIVVGNPVVESHDSALELRFDITNKSDDRAEGYIWAVAEFKTDAGTVQYIGAPFEIAAQSGDPKHPERSAIFGIKRFKRKSFTFPIVKGQPGKFTGLKIGVMDRSGAKKTTYNVPIDVRVGAGESG